MLLYISPRVCYRNTSAADMMRRRFRRRAISIRPRLRRYSRRAHFFAADKIEVTFRRDFANYLFLATQSIILSMKYAYLPINSHFYRLLFHGI